MNLLGRSKVMKVHVMNLNPEPFNMIKEGKKTKKRRC